MDLLPANIVFSTRAGSRSRSQLKLPRNRRASAKDELRNTEGDRSYSSCRERFSWFFLARPRANRSSFRAEGSGFAFVLSRSTLHVGRLCHSTSFFISFYLSNSIDIQLRWTTSKTQTISRSTWNVFGKLFWKRLRLVFAKIALMLMGFQLVGPYRAMKPHGAITDTRGLQVGFRCQRRRFTESRFTGPINFYAFLDARNLA